MNSLKRTRDCTLCLPILSQPTLSCTKTSAHQVARHAVVE